MITTKDWEVVKEYLDGDLVTSLEEHDVNQWYRYMDLNLPDVLTMQLIKELQRIRIEGIRQVEKALPIFIDPQNLKKKR